MRYCAYYQADVVREQTWFLVAVLRSYEHVAFDRTLDKRINIFEFFVPHDTEQLFEQVLIKLQQAGALYCFRKMENRLLDPLESV